MEARSCPVSTLSSVSAMASAVLCPTIAAPTTATSVIIFATTEPEKVIGTIRSRKEKVEQTLHKYGIVLDNAIAYDHVYVLNMALADFYGSSITDERALALFVKDYVDDEDQPDGFVFNRFYADCALSGTPIPWEDVLDPS